MERNPAHVRVALANLERAGLGDRVIMRIGPALEVLPEIARERHGPFDLIFIDADKRSSPEYFAWALRLARPGSLIIVDNVVRDGAVAGAGSDDPDVGGVRRLLDALAAEPRVQATAIQTVGSKGYDGFVIALVTTAPA